MNKYQNKAILAVVLIVSLISLSYISLTFTDGDEGRYLYLAKAIADGHGQTNIHLPSPVPEGLTPPGYPYLLSLFAHGEQLPMFWPKALSWLAYLAYSLMIILLFKRLFDSEICSYTLLALCALLPVSALIYTWSIFSETLFLFISSLALLTVIRGQGGLKEAIITGFLIAVAMAIRPLGIALIPAIGLHYLWRRKWVPLICCAMTFLLAYSPVLILTYKALGVPFGHMSHYGAEGTLFDSLMQLVHTELLLLPYFIFQSMPKMLYFSLFDGDCLLAKLQLSWMIAPLSITLAIFMLVGLATRIRKLHFFDLYAIVYLLLICSYGVNVARGIEDRYILPLLPYAVLYIYLGLRFLAQPFPCKKGILKVFIIVSTSYILLTSIGAGFIRAKKEWEQKSLSPYSPERQLNVNTESHQAFGRYLEACEWVKENIQKPALIVSRKPKHTYLISEHKGFRLAEIKHANETPFETITRYKSDATIYIIQDAFPLDSGYGKDRALTIDPMLKAHADQFEKIFTTEQPETAVWKWVPSED